MIFLFHLIWHLFAEYTFFFYIIDIILYNWQCSSSHLGSCTLRVSTFATIVDHTFLSSVIDSSRPCSLMSLLILSIHLMRGLPLGLFPGISISSTVLVMSSGFLRFICPYQLSRRFVTWSTIVITLSLFRISSLLTWSFKLIPWIQPSILISVLFSRCSSFFLMAQHSAPCSMVGLISLSGRSSLSALLALSCRKWHPSFLSIYSMTVTLCSCNLFCPSLSRKDGANILECIRTWYFFFTQL